jgi:hypothetical protein
MMIHIGWSGSARTLLRSIIRRHVLEVKRFSEELEGLGCSGSASRRKPGGEERRGEERLVICVGITPGKAFPLNLRNDSSFSRQKSGSDGEECHDGRVVGIVVLRRWLAWPAVSFDVACALDFENRISRLTTSLLLNHYLHDLDIVAEKNRAIDYIKR